jgi:hypothetical protein
VNTVSLVAVGDDTLEAIKEPDGTVWVVVRRVCEALGIDAKTQQRKIESRSTWATKVIMTSDASGRSRMQTCIDLDSLPVWLANVDEARVSDAVRPKLVRFQREVRDVLARHFGGSRTSGGGAVSGRRVDTQPLTSGQPLGALSIAADARAFLAVTKSLSDALEATIGEVERVKAQTERVEHFAIDVAQRQQQLGWRLEKEIDEVAAVANDAAASVSRLAREQGQLRESSRRRLAAVGHITSEIRRHCARTATPYQQVYSEVRADLGLRRTQHGGPALGKANLRADQVLRLARTATRLGVPGCGVLVIEAILNGEDDPTRPGFVDVATKAVQ